MNNIKKSKSIYQNKTGLILDKRKNSIINNKIISNYTHKPGQYSYIDSLERRRINAKKNNSVCLVSNYQKCKESFINYKFNDNASKNNLEMNTSNYNLL